MWGYHAAFHKYYTPSYYVPHTQCLLINFMMVGSLDLPFEMIRTTAYHSKTLFFSHTSGHPKEYMRRQWV